METNKEIVELEDVLENLSIQLQRCRAVSGVIFKALFANIEPNKDYTYFYDRYVSLDGVVDDYLLKMDKIINQALEDIKKSPRMAGQTNAEQKNKDIFQN